jgi:hypothetical protein
MFAQLVTAERGVNGHPTLAHSDQHHRLLAARAALIRHDDKQRSFIISKETS